MTHKHEWSVGNDGEPFAFCLVGGIGGCQEILDKEQIERRLNATECLSAEDAMASVEATNELAEVAREVGLLDVRYVVSDDDPLLLYARALEGSDE